MDIQRILSITKALKLPFSSFTTGNSFFTFSDMIRLLSKYRRDKFGKAFLNAFSKEDLFLSLFLVYMEKREGISPQETLKMMDRAFIIVLLEDLGNQSTTTCEECGGDGGHDCAYCEQGVVDCGECIQGENECYSCDGTGEVDGEVCSTCDGHGVVGCNHCDGDGELTCDDCDGDGRLECGYCDGDGLVYEEGRNYFSLSIWITMDPNLKKYQVGESIDQSEFNDIKNNSHLILHEEHMPLTIADWPQVSGKHEIIVVGSTDNSKFFDSLVDTVMVDYRIETDLDEIENLLLDYFQPGKTYFAE